MIDTKFCVCHGINWVFAEYIPLHTKQSFAAMFERTDFKWLKQGVTKQKLMYNEMMNVKHCSVLEAQVI